jgi:hypothetical protein
MVAAAQDDSGVRRRRGLSWAVAVGAVLGAASFAADLAGGALRDVLQFVASTGFAWGCAAFAVAAFAASRRGAIVGAIVVLGTATVGYYGLNLVAGRWPAGGPAPVLTAAAYWLLLSAAGGAALGALAHVVREGRGPVAAAAGGVACGLLAGAGVEIAVDHARTHLADGLLQALAGVAVATWAFGRRRGVRSWPRYAVAALVACTGGAMAWALVESVPVFGF